MATVDLSAIELKDPDVYVDGVPHASFRLLREHDPVHWHPETAPDPGFWAITKHADVVAISKDPERFSSAERFIYYEEIPADAMEMRRSMIETWGGSIVASPSMDTNAGRAILETDPDCPGSLGIAISEAVEDAATECVERAKAALRSALGI